jgi:hypothetical protein
MAAGAFVEVPPPKAGSAMAPMHHRLKGGPQEDLNRIGGIDPPTAHRPNRSPRAPWLRQRNPSMGMVGRAAQTAPATRRAASEPGPRGRFPRSRKRRQACPPGAYVDGPPNRRLADPDLPMELKVGYGARRFTLPAALIFLFLLGSLTLLDNATRWPPGKPSWARAAAVVEIRRSR